MAYSPSCAPLQIHFKLREPGFLHEYEGFWMFSDDGDDGAEGESGIDEVHSGAGEEQSDDVQAEGRSVGDERGSGNDIGRNSEDGDAAARVTLRGEGGEGGGEGEAADAARSRLPTSDQDSATAARKLAGARRAQGVEELVGGMAAVALVGGGSRRSGGAGGRCRVRAEFSLCPSLSPPFPLNHLLKGQQLRQVQEQLRSLVALAAATWGAASE